MSQIDVNVDMTDQQVINAVEGANPLDVVVLTPGTYRTRLLLYKPGVTFKGSDPNNRPVLDFTGQPIESWPGTLSNWHAKYGLEVQADDVLVEDMVIKGAKSTAGNAANFMNGPLGFVAEPASPGSQTNNVVLRNVEISGGDDGIGSVGNNFVIDNCEVHHNGNPGGSKVRHGLYAHGGTVDIINSHFHSATQGENVHTRAKTTIIDNSIMGPVFSNYPLGMYTDKADQPKDGSPFTQRFIIRNSTIDCRRPDGGNTTKMITTMNSNAYEGLTQYIELYNNTYLGANNDDAAIVQLVRGVGHVKMGLISSGNNWDAFNGSRFLYLMAGQNPNDGFYDIQVSDYVDASLPVGSGGGGSEPPAPVTVNIRASWNQEMVDGLEGWRLYAGTSQATLSQVADIPYAAGAQLVHEQPITVTEGTIYFALKAYGTGSRVTPYSDLTSAIISGGEVLPPLPVPTNLVIELLP